MTSLYIETESLEEITRPHDPEDEWSGEDTHTSWDLLGAHLSEGRAWRERYDVDFDVAVGDRVWVVFAIWSDGDTFSHRSAVNGECLGIYETEIEAQDRERELRNTRLDGRPWPWDGYFENLDLVLVEEFTVQP